MPQLFVPNATPQLAQQGFTSGKIDTSITNRDPSKALDPMVKAAEAFEAYDIKMQEQADDTAALTAINNFTAASQKRFTDLASKENEAAAEDYKTYDSDIDKFASQFSAGLNPRAARKYQEQVAKLTITSKANGYAFDVKRSHDQQENELLAAVTNGQQQAVGAFGTAAFGAQMSLLDENAAHYIAFKGVDANSEQAQNILRKSHQEVYKTGINNLITTKSFGAASSALKQYGAEMDQFDVSDLRARLQAAIMADAKEKAGGMTALEKLIKGKKKIAEALAGAGTADGYTRAYQVWGEIRQLDPDGQYAPEADAMRYQYGSKVGLKIQKQSDEIRSNERQAALDTIANYKTIDNDPTAKTKIGEQIKRYLNNGGDVERAMSIDANVTNDWLKSAKQAKEKEVTEKGQELRRLIANDKERNDHKTLGEHLQRAVELGEMTVEEAQSEDSTFVYKRNKQSLKEQQQQQEKQEAKLEKQRTAAVANWNTKIELLNGLPKDEKHKDQIVGLLKEGINLGIDPEILQLRGEKYYDIAKKEYDKEQKELETKQETARKEAISQHKENARNYASYDNAKGVREEAEQLKLLGVSGADLESFYEARIHEINERQQNKISQENEKNISRALTQADHSYSVGKIQDAIRWIDMAEALGYPAVWAKADREYFVDKDKVEQIKEDKKVMIQIQKDRVADAQRYIKDNQIEMAMRSIDDAVAAGLDKPTEISLRSSASNDYVQQQVDFAVRAFKNGTDGTEFLKKAAPYVGYVSADKQADFMQQATKAQSGAFIDIVNDVAKVSKGMASSMIEARGTVGLTHNDAIKAQTIQQGFQNDSYQSYVENAIATKDGKALGDLLYTKDKDGNQVLTPIATAMENNQPELFDKAVSQYTQINLENKENEQARTLRFKGFDPDTMDATFERVMNLSLYGTEGQKDGLIDITLAERNLKDTKENRAAIEIELRKNPKLIAEANAQVKELSDAEYRKVDAQARREHDAFNMLMDEYNKGLISGKYNRADISNAENPIARMPEAQKLLDKLYPNPTDSDEQEKKNVMDQFNRSVNKDVIGDPQIFTSMVNNLSEDMIKQTRQEYFQNIRTLHDAGLLSNKQVNTLEQNWISAEQAKYDETKKDSMTAIRNLVALKQFDADNYNQCTSGQQIAINEGVSKLLDYARKLTNFSRDPNALSAGIKMALKDPKIKEEIGFGALRAKMIDEIFTGGTYADATQEAVDATAPNDPRRREVNRQKKR